MKKEDLLPAIVQDVKTGRVLMMGWVNDESLRITRETGRMTFFSRSRQRLWTKGEESGNYLYVKEILEDCDKDTLLVRAEPAGPACHTGSDTCWGEKNVPFGGSAGGNARAPITDDSSGLGVAVTPGDSLSGFSGDSVAGSYGQKSAAGFTAELESIIESRRGADPASSYTAKLLAGGPRKIAKKLGEESAELIIESMDDKDDLFLNEAADLLYHYLVLLHYRNHTLADVEAILRERHK
jgi:phosphoribosyl-AMP cyclohydrolase / phosphoribosyl-ATP pyrophosphohydrolase